MAVIKVEAPVEIKESEDGKLHISYIPDTTQIFRAGKEYEFIFTVTPPEGKKQEKA